MLHRATLALFQAFVTLGLVAPSITRGPLSWLPIVRIGSLNDAAIGIGPVALLPGLALLTWLLARATQAHARPWRWGRPVVTLPLVGITLLAMLSLEPVFNRRTVLTALQLGLLWWMYLFALNERPDLTLPLSLAIMIQSGVAIGQFALQRDVGLHLLAEATLDPQQSGTCVLLTRDQRWLRAYGLTGHPNLLGALLSVLLLLILDKIAEASGWQKTWFALVGSMGLIGLLTTFSRNAWLAFILGVACWLARRTVMSARSLKARAPSLPGLVTRFWRKYAQLIVPAIAAAAYLFLFRDLVGSRFFHLETPIEARSIDDRQTDAALALKLIKQHPWSGVGINNYLPAVRALESDSRIVHNVPLLVAAELGLPGVALWTGLSLVGLTQIASRGWPPWVAMLVVGVFDITLFPLNNWHAAVVFGLLSAGIQLPVQAARPASKKGDRPGRERHAYDLG